MIVKKVFGRRLWKKGSRRRRTCSGIPYSSSDSGASLSWCGKRRGHCQMSKSWVTAPGAGAAAGAGREGRRRGSRHGCTRIAPSVMMMMMMMMNEVNHGAELRVYPLQASVSPLSQSFSASVCLCHFQQERGHVCVGVHYYFLCPCPSVFLVALTITNQCTFGVPYRLPISNRQRFGSVQA